MPFDPNWPPADADLLSAPFREQFNALKALIDAQAAAIAALQGEMALLRLSQVPIGGTIGWYKNTPGVPALPANFVECNGQFLDDPESLLHGQMMPDMNTGVQRFPRGGLVSGLTGGIDTFATASADNSGLGTPFTVVTPDFSPGAVPIPPYQTTVYVIRVK